MKLNESYTFRTICGQHVLSPEGLASVDMSHIISLNDTAAFLWNSLSGKDFTPEDAVNLLTGEYEVSRERAAADVDVLLEKWKEIGLLA